MRTRVLLSGMSWPWLKNLSENRLYSENFEQMQDKPDKAELPRTIGSVLLEDLLE